MTTASSDATPVVRDAPTRSQLARRRYIVLGLVVGLAGIGYGAYRVVTGSVESTDDAQVDANVVPLGAQVSATVEHVLVKDDSEVKKGQLLVEFSRTAFEVKLKAAKAALAAAKARAAAAKAEVDIVTASAKGGLSSAKAELGGSTVAVHEANDTVSAAQAALSKAQTVEKKAKRDLDRIKELSARGSVSNAELDAAESTHDLAESSVEQAKAELAAAKSGVRTAQSRVGQAQGHLTQSAPVDARLDAARAASALADAEVKSAEANVERAELELGDTKVFAPADGRLSKLAVREGQLVQTGQTLVVLVPDETYVVANFKETQVGRMHAGQHADVEVDAYPGRKFAGHVESVSPGTGARFSLLPPDNASGNFVKVVQRVPVHVVWEHPGEVKLQAGLSANVSVDTR
jgi:membrane fusion protein, multidrug efflux system